MARAPTRAFSMALPAVRPRLQPGAAAPPGVSRDRYRWPGPVAPGPAEPQPGASGGDV